MLPGGADFQLITSETMARLEARYVLETNAGDRIYVHDEAVRTRAGGNDARASFAASRWTGRGLLPLPAALRVRGRRRSAWIGERVYVSVGVRRPPTMVMSFFECSRGGCRPGGRRRSA